MAETVFFFSSAAILGGAERSLQELLTELGRRGHTCVLITPPGAPLQTWAAEQDLPHEAFEMRSLREGNPLGQILSVRRFANTLVARYGRGVFYSNTRHAFTLLAMLPGRYPKLAHHRDVSSRPINRWLYPRMDCNIFISEFNYAHSDAPANGRVILNAGALDCDLPPVLPAPASGPLNMAMFARITGYKGHRVALAACRGLAAAGQTYQLDIWGEPADARDRALLADLRDDVAGAGLAVRFCGFHPKPTDILRDYHVILNPSLGEPFGRLPVEGFSLGVPVISHASGGSLEIYAGLEAYAPYLFPDHDGDSLCRALLRLIEAGATEPDATRAQLSCIRADIRARFSLRRLGDDIETVIEEFA